MKKIIKYWKKSKIRTQIIFTYILILLLSFVMTFSMIWAVNNKYTKEEIGKAGVQTVSALQGNLALVFENVTQLSTYLYFDDIVQDSLRQINSANIDLNYMLVETDCPYITPHPFRGKRNESAYIIYTIEEIAKIREMSILEIEKITYNNAYRAFNLEVSNEKI